MNNFNVVPSQGKFGESISAINQNFQIAQQEMQILENIVSPRTKYATVVATSQTESETDVLPSTGSTDTIYRVGNWDGAQFDETAYTEYAWGGTMYVPLSTNTQIGEVFDISAYHATGGELATYADLAAALDSNNGGGVPQSLQRGGMSVKFVQSSDNKYVQYRLMSDDWSIIPSDWVLVGISLQDALFANGGSFTLQQGNIEQGIWNLNGSKGSSSTRIRLLNDIVVAKGTIVRFTPGSNVAKMDLMVFDINTSQRLQYTSDWVDTNVTINYDGLLRLSFRNSGNTSIVPSDYDATTIIDNQVSIKTSQITGKKEIVVGNSVLPVDFEPEVNSHNLVESGGVSLFGKHINNGVYIEKGKFIGTLNDDIHYYNSDTYDCVWIFIPKNVSKVILNNVQGDEPFYFFNSPVPSTESYVVRNTTGQVPSAGAVMCLRNLSKSLNPDGYDTTYVTYDYKIDEIPEIGSHNPVESGGVALELLEPYPPYNLINPKKCFLKKYINQNGEIANAQSYRYAVCCVKAVENGIVANVTTGSFPKFLVINASGTNRVIQTGAYTYQEGDMYLYINMFADVLSTDATKEDLIDYISKNLMAVIGTELPNVFIPYGITESVYNKFLQVLSSIDSTNNSIDKLEFDSSLNRSYQGFNAINPETIIYNSLINNNTISIGTATSKNALAVIRAPREGIIVNCSRTDVNTTSPFAVVKEDGTVRYYSFTGEAVNKYTYQDGDKYLYIYIFDSTASTNDDMYQYVKSFVMGLIGEEELPTYHVPYDYTKEDCKRLHDLEYESYILKARHRAENVGLLMAEDGSVNTSKTSYRVTDAISLVGYDKITFQGIWSNPGNYAGLVLYNENDEVVHFINNISTGELYLNAYPTAVSVRVSGYYENTIYVSLFKKQSELKIKSRIIIVDCKGYGDYTSIDDAIAAANDSNDNQITIIVKPGTYTTKGERTDERAPEYQHPYEMNKRNLTIIGTDRERCILRNDIGIYDTHAYDDSVLRLCGNVTIKNLTLISTHNDYDQSVEGSDRLSAYCLHLDKPVNSGDVCVVDNCTMISENGPCIGSGLKNGLTIIVRNCSAKLTHHRNADEYYTWHGVFYFHGWNDAVAGQSANLEVKNCVLENVLDPKAININGLSANDQINYLLAFNIAKTSNTQNSVTTSYNVVKSELSFGNNVESMNYTV